MPSNKAKNTAQEQELIGVESFTMEAPKAVAPIEADDLKHRSGTVQEDGKTKTFTNIEQSIINNLDGQVQSIIQKIESSPLHSKEFKDITDSLNEMGNHEIAKTSSISNRMLARPLKALSQNDFGNGKSIASSLKQLRTTVTNLDPTQKGKLLNRHKIFGIKIPFNLGNRVDSYMQEFKSSQSQIDDIVKSLLNGKDELIEDSAHIDEEREQLASLMNYLEQYAYVIKQIDSNITEKISKIELEDKIKASDIKQEILFPIRQKSIDIYQHLAVCMQSYMSLQVIKKNNTELIRGVDRATKTTIAALQTAILVSEALGTQKLVLDQIGAVNEITNGMITRNSEMLKDQGLQIQKKATDASISVEVLNKSFEQIFSAIDTIENYRNEALPNMKKTIESLEKTVSNAKGYLSKEREKRIGTFIQESNHKVSQDDNKTIQVI